MLSRIVVTPGYLGPVAPLPPIPSFPRPCPDYQQSLQRDVSVCGRNDGNSYARKQQRRKQSSRKGRDTGGPSGSGTAWWEDDDALAQQPQQQQQSFRGTSSRPRSDGRSSRSRREEEEDDDAGQGWWQKPEESSMQAYRPGELSGWQVTRLEQAYAIGRRKVKIQELAQELGLDRQEVIQWMKDFALKPESERTVILKQHQTDKADSHPRTNSRLAQQPATVLEPPATGRVQHPSTQQGFIPFYTRKEMGLTEMKNKRLSADAQRTLESIYQRTPYPSNDVIKGVWNLHRVNRETVLQWLDARRQQDGLASNEERRKGASNLTLDMSPAKLREAIGTVGYDSNNLLSRLMSDGSAPDASEPAAEQPPQLVPVSGKLLAQLKSSLPSPQKFKGKARSEAMGIKQDAVSLEVGGVRYEQVQRPSGAVSKWTASWRHRRARAPSKALPLLLSTLDSDQEAAV